MEIKEEIFENGYTCDICGKHFSRKVQFNKHSLQHASIVELDCRSDSEIKPRKRRSRRKKISKLNKHSHLDPLRCNDCGKKLKKLANNHSCNSQKTFKCMICKNTYLGRLEYNRHKCSTDERKPFSCSKCNAQFSWRDQLSYHSCDVDQANQSQVSESKHEDQSVSDMLSSAEVDHFQCPVDETSKEERHEINFDKHQLSDFKLWSNHQSSVTCEVCMKVFPHKTACYRHACTRIEETPYSCSKCKEQFLWQEGLECHTCNQNQDNKTLVSGNEQSHPSLSSMNVDILLSSNDGLVKCGMCQRTFAQKGHLILHYRRHHKRELIAIDV